MYTMICACLDILQAAKVICKFMEKLGREYWEAMKLILRCLKETINPYLSFGGYTCCK